jgi:hypothetical protein
MKRLLFNEVVSFSVVCETVGKKENCFLSSKEYMLNR